MRAISESEVRDGDLAENGETEMAIRTTMRVGEESAAEMRAVAMEMRGGMEQVEGLCGDGGKLRWRRVDKMTQESVTGMLRNKLGKALLNPIKITEQPLVICKKISQNEI